MYTITACTPDGMNSEVIATAPDLPTAAIVAATWVRHPYIPGHTDVVACATPADEQTGGYLFVDGRWEESW